jgi:hypothetical protein
MFVFIERLSNFKGFCIELFVVVFVIGGDVGYLKILNYSYKIGDN